MASRQENMKSLFRDSRTRAIIVSTFLLMFIMLVVGIVGMRKHFSKVDTEARITSAPIGRIDETPGSFNPSAEYARIQSDRNKQKADAAEKNGNSAIPTIIKQHKPGEEGFSLEGKEVSGGTGFSKLSIAQNSKNSAGDVSGALAGVNGANGQGGPNGGAGGGANGSGAGANGANKFGPGGPNGQGLGGANGQGGLGGANGQGFGPGGANGQGGLGGPNGQGLGGANGQGGLGGANGQGFGPGGANGQGGLGGANGQGGLGGASGQGFGPGGVNGQGGLGGANGQGYGPGGNGQGGLGGANGQGFGPGGPNGQGFGGLNGQGGLGGANGQGYGPGGNGQGGGADGMNGADGEYGPDGKRISGKNSKYGPGGAFDTSASGIAAGAYYLQKYQDNLSRGAQGEQIRKQQLQKVQQNMSTVGGQMFQSWATANQQYMPGETLKDGQRGRDGLNGPGGNNPNDNKNKPVLFKAGTIAYAVLDTAINSDEPGPVMATIVGGEFQGGRLIGSMKRNPDGEKVLLSFDLLSLPQFPNSLKINSVAVDPNTSRTAFSSYTDRHLMVRYGTLFASAFLAGMGQAIQQSATQVSTNLAGGVTVSMGNSQLSSKEKFLMALGTLGQRWGGQLAPVFAQQPTVYVKSGLGMGVLFLDDVTLPE